VEQLYHKQGDTFSISCTWTDVNGDPIDLTGYDIKSQVKSFSDTPFEDDLSVAVLVAASGTFSVTASAIQTTLWPVTMGQYKRLFCDVQFKFGGVTTSTETFEIIVLREITG